MQPSIQQWSSDLLAFWFGPLDNDTVLRRDEEPFATLRKKWYASNPAMDDECRNRFVPVLEAVTESAHGWLDVRSASAESPRVALATIVLLDQIPRNAFRGTPRMYEYDTLAAAHAYWTVERGLHKHVPLPYRHFVHSPFLHAESLTLQELACHLAAVLADEAQSVCPHSTEFYEVALDFAKRHRDIVVRFGRFPHRNKILGRISTPEEAKALAEEKIGF